MVYNNSDNGERNIDSDSGMGDKDVYKERAEPVLVSPSNSYSKLDLISVGVNGPSSCSISHCLLTTFYLLS